MKQVPVPPFLALKLDLGTVFMIPIERIKEPSPDPNGFLAQLHSASFANRPSRNPLDPSSSSTEDWPLPALSVYQVKFELSSLYQNISPIYISKLLHTVISLQ